jgi:hypothetical protein
MNVRRIMARALSVFLSCNVLVLSVTTQESRAGDVTKRVQIHVGKPSVWSMAQAHYLLAKLHKDNRDLKTHMPSESALDPNAINTTRIQILKTLLDVEGQYSQKVGVENQSALREQQDKYQQREEARLQRSQIQNQLDDVNRGLLHHTRQLNGMKATDAANDRIRHAGEKDKDGNSIEVPPTQDQIQLKTDIAALQANVDAENQQKATLTQQLKDTNAIANGTVDIPKLSEVELSKTSAALPEPTYVKGLIDNAVKDSGKPSLAASIALDNFVGMQYEIIAKQLTLLRDEVGPDERIVFLELPSSIYTVPGKGDDYLAQVQWKVTGYYDDRQVEESMMDENREDHTDIKAIVNHMSDLKKYQAALQDETKRMEKGKLSGERAAEWRKADLDIRKAAIQKEIDQAALELKRLEQDGVSRWKAAFSSNVRALDVIPRQSALNVNEVQAKASQVNFLGVMKLLIGLGVKVNYQRQRELYEQYLQQEVFASGFGKGLNAFGWTFGPQPGTNRIAPGVRTTYAVLAVPRETSALRIEATGIAYHRRHAPDYDLDFNQYDLRSRQVVTNDEFIVRIPNEHTEQFRVQSIAYTAASKGAPVTVIVKGDYFSPQVGVLVDGVALKRALSVGNTATSDALDDNTTGTGIRGQYELVSSRELVMKFAMGDATNTYVGTPNITLITPEKSTSINFIPLQINYHYPRTALRDLAIQEPMFTDGFSLKEELALADSNDGFKDGRLKGTGFRRKAEIWVNNRRIPVLKDRKWELIKERTDELVSDSQGYQEILLELVEAHPELLLEEPAFSKFQPKELTQELVDGIFESKPEIIADYRVEKDPKTGHYVHAIEQRDQFSGKKEKDSTPRDRTLNEDEKDRILEDHQEFASEAFEALLRKKGGLEDALNEYLSKHPELNLKEVIAREVLINQFAEDYMRTLCWKNAVRGRDCTAESKNIIRDRRREELLGDNVDPFHQDEPYHNEELYKEIKKQQIDRFMKRRRQFVRAWLLNYVIAGKESVPTTRAQHALLAEVEFQAAQKLIEIYAQQDADKQYAEFIEKLCRDKPDDRLCKEPSPEERNDIEKAKKKELEKRESKRRNELQNLEALYERIAQHIKEPVSPSQSSPVTTSGQASAPTQSTKQQEPSRHRPAKPGRGGSTKEQPVKQSSANKKPGPYVVFTPRRSQDSGYTSVNKDISDNKSAYDTLSEAYKRIRDAIATCFAADPNYLEEILPDEFGKGINEMVGRLDEDILRLRATKEIEDKYENPNQGEDYARQESTTAYTLHFRDEDGAKEWTVRYSQSRINGFDAYEFTKKTPPSELYEVVHYTPNSGGAKALVDVRFNVGKGNKLSKVEFRRKKDQADTYVQPGVVEEPIVEKDGVARATLSIPYEDRGRSKAEREHIWVELVTRNESGKEESKNLDLKLPVRPIIAKILNPRTHTSKGYADEQPVVTLVGFNLQNVAKVFFGDKEALPKGSPDYTSLLVQVPKVDSVKNGEAIQVPIRIETKDGTQVSSAIYYTYVGQPIPVVIYQPRPTSGNGRRVNQADGQAEIDGEPYVDEKTDDLGKKTRPRRAKPENKKR